MTMKETVIGSLNIFKRNLLNCQLNWARAPARMGLPMLLVTKIVVLSPAILHISSSSSSLKIPRIRTPHTQIWESYLPSKADRASKCNIYYRQAKVLPIGICTLCDSGLSQSLLYMTLWIRALVAVVQLQLRQLQALYLATVVAIPCQRISKLQIGTHISRNQGRWNPDPGPQPVHTALASRLPVRAIEKGRENSVNALDKKWQWIWISLRALMGFLPCLQH